MKTECQETAKQRPKPPLARGNRTRNEESEKHLMGATKNLLKAADDALRGKKKKTSQKTAQQRATPKRNKSRKEEDNKRTIASWICLQPLCTRASFVFAFRLR